MAQEFLPLCDILFNIISLAAYFCDIVFDIVTIYTLYSTHQTQWFVSSLAFVATSLISCQILSYRWHYSRNDDQLRTRSNHFFLLTALHCLQCGVLWRYFKLFVPLDLRHVKLDVRDLCILRMIHAFAQSIPMLMIQLYIIWSRDVTQVTRLNLLSTVLSLINVCWALASFNKYVRTKDVHKLVLTWLGVVSQLFWRVGTVSSRVVVLTVYATLYRHWTLLVIFLHWLSMFLWLTSRNAFRSEKPVQKHLLSATVGFVYVFCYVNLDETKAWKKMAVFYTTMCLENSLLMAVWLLQRPAVTWFEVPAVTITWGGFTFGMVAMLIYHRCFHLRRIRYADRGDCEAAKTTAKNTPVRQVNGGYVPGVFNCRLNPALKRKKKKPTTFVPPPVPVLSLTGKMDCPFWKRSTAKPVSSDQEGSSGSRVNIRQKLEEKKLQQLQELKEIEEEIKQGKLKRPKPVPMSRMHLIPRSKKRPVVNGKKPRAKTPEILLSPRLLENYVSRNGMPCKMEPFAQHPIEVDFTISAAKDRSYLMYKSYRIPSDLDSQLSLPRSYTLPREFRYHRKSRSRKPIRCEHFVASTNSSDGDVDSVDDEVGDGDSACSPRYVWPSYRVYNRHETKL